jgi:hypothetical protein
MADLVRITALALSAMIVLVLLAQYLNLLSIGRFLKDKGGQSDAHLAEQRRYERENREDMEFSTQQDHFIPLNHLLPDIALTPPSNNKSRHCKIVIITLTSTNTINRKNF